ncbi:MAG: ABC transporter ATP-binding protein [bacterium]
MPALRLAGIRKAYGRHTILRDLDLDVAAGETVAILGANGSGKSTLLRVCATIARPDVGSIEVGGVDARKEPEAARRKTAILLQDAPAYAELTPHEHLSWWARLHGLGLPGDAIEAATVDAGLAPSAHKPTGLLSRGQRQRLAIAMALLPACEVTLLDEPFAGLDDAGRRWAEARLAGRGGAVLLVVHDESDAQRLADRALRLEGGRLR